MADGLIETFSDSLPLYAVAPAGLENLLARLPAVQGAWLRTTGF
jgi:hypothetical protein